MERFFEREAVLSGRSLFLPLIVAPIFLLLRLFYHFSNFLSFPIRSDCSDDGSEDQSDGESEQLSGNFINDGDYTQDSRASGGQQHMYYAVNNALEEREQDSQGLCR